MRYRIRSALITITAEVLLGSGPALAESNACKADLTADSVVNFADLAVLKSVFFQSCNDPGPTCGDDVAQGPTEECDDGNTKPGDGCSAICTIERPYVDNGDGTITDSNTGLMWEKLSDDGSIHDWNSSYTWSTGEPWHQDGTAFTVKIATLNGGGGFAGYTDWRLPALEELMSILQPKLELLTLVPKVNPAFNTGCVPGCTVTTCSCTQSEIYWSSSRYHGYHPQFAWSVPFFGRFAETGTTMTANFYVRAVRSAD